MRSKSKTKLQTGPILAEGGHLLDGEKDIVERFNQYFAIIFTTDPPTTSAASNNFNDSPHRYFSDEMATCSDTNLDIDVIIQCYFSTKA